MSSWPMTSENLRPGTDRRDHLICAHGNPPSLRMTKAPERSIARTPAGATLAMLLMRWFSIKMKTLFAIFPVLTSSNRPALIATGAGVGEGVGLGETVGVWECDVVVVKTEIASAIVPAANRVPFIGRRVRRYSPKPNV